MKLSIHPERLDYIIKDIKQRTCLGQSSAFCMRQNERRAASSSARKESICSHAGHAVLVVKHGCGLLWWMALHRRENSNQSWDQGECTDLGAWDPKAKIRWQWTDIKTWKVLDRLECSRCAAIRGGFPIPLGTWNTNTGPEDQSRSSRSGNNYRKPTRIRHINAWKSCQPGKNWAPITGGKVWENRIEPAPTLFWFQSYHGIHTGSADSVINNAHLGVEDRLSDGRTLPSGQIPSEWTILRDTRRYFKIENEEESQPVGCRLGYTFDNRGSNAAIGIRTFWLPEDDDKQHLRLYTAAALVRWACPIGSANGTNTLQEGCLAFSVGLKKVTCGLTVAEPVAPPAYNDYLGQHPLDIVEAIPEVFRNKGRQLAMLFCSQTEGSQILPSNFIGRNTWNTTWCLSQRLGWIRCRGRPVQTLGTERNWFALFQRQRCDQTSIWENQMNIEGWNGICRSVSSNVTEAAKPTTAVWNDIRGI